MCAFETKQSGAFTYPNVAALPVTLDDLSGEFLVVLLALSLQLVAIRGQQTLERLAHDQKRNGALHGLLQFGARWPRKKLPGQLQRRFPRLHQERWIDAG